MNTKNDRNQKNQRQETRPKQGPKKRVQKQHEQEQIETRMTR
jgi:hypothetical protein